MSFRTTTSGSPGKSAVVLLLLLVTEHGCRPQVRRELPEPAPVREAASLPIPQGDVVWADGYGPTKADAILDARRTVAEKIAGPDASFALRSLIKIRGIGEMEGGFAARAAVERAQAAEAFSTDLDSLRERIAETVHVVEAALSTRDTSVLLSARHNPGSMLARQDRLLAILETLGASQPTRPDPGLVALEERASAARRQAVIGLVVAGDASEPIRRAVTEQVSALLGENGCALQESASPDAVARLELVVRNRSEGGMLWRYLGLELTIRDKKTQGLILAYSEPELAHAGGSSWESADYALARRVAEKMASKAVGPLAAIDCR